MCFNDGREHDIFQVVARMLELGTYHIAPEFAVHPLSADAMQSQWEIALRQYRAHSEPDAVYKDVCIGPCLARAAMTGRPYPDTRIPYTSNLPYEQRMREMMKLCGRGPAAWSCLRLRT